MGGVQGQFGWSCPLPGLPCDGLVPVTATSGLPDLWNIVFFEGLLYEKLRNHEFARKATMHPGAGVAQFQSVLTLRL